jgi:putative aminopeptidase FrvX
MNFEQYKDYLVETATSLLAIDSPSGFTDKATDYILNLATDLDFSASRNNLGNVYVTIEGKNNDEAVALSAHIDTLGLMVRSITADGHLMVTPVGSPIFPTLDGEYCKIYTMDDKVYTGTILSLSPAIHVYKDACSRTRDAENMAVRIDEIVHSKDDVAALGISTGDFVCYDPKTTYTESGFFKSRFIDDKGCAALLLTLMKMLKDSGLKPEKKTYLCFVTHEEIGYGGSTFPSDISEALIVDMGCVGEDLACTEEQVSICSKDSVGPYDYNMNKKLVTLAKKHNIDAVTDIYPQYGSDAAAMWRAGYDARAALIGPGVHASHGMERTHMKGFMNTLKLIAAYLDLI